MEAAVDTWYDADNPVVSIIILNFNNSKITIECLEAIRRWTTDYRYEVIVVDNGSDPHHVAALSGAGPYLRLIELPTNHYFGPANNIAARHAKGNILVFLNNDAFVTSGWLPPLVHILENRKQAGAVGPKFINLDGTLQEAGAFIDSHGDPIQIGRVDPYHPEEEKVVKIVDYCSAACLLIQRRLFLELGSFDETFSPAYYEDGDLCLRIASYGLYVYYCPSSVVVHIRNTTSDQVWTPAQLYEISARNRQMFAERWGGYLRAREL